MKKCNDCGIESEEIKGWYAELSDAGRLMRCPDCGIKEQERLLKYHYGDSFKKKEIEDVPKDERIEYARKLREAGVSPWRHRKEE